MTSSVKQHPPPRSSRGGAGRWGRRRWGEPDRVRQGRGRAKGAPRGVASEAALKIVHRNAAPCGTALLVMLVGVSLAQHVRPGGYGGGGRPPSTHGMGKAGGVAEGRMSVLGARGAPAQPRVAGEGCGAHAQRVRWHGGCVAWVSGGFRKGARSNLQKKRNATRESLHTPARAQQTQPRYYNVSRAVCVVRRVCAKTLHSVPRPVRCPPWVYRPSLLPVTNHGGTHPGRLDRTRRSATRQ